MIDATERLRLNGVSKTFDIGAGATRALADVNVSIRQGEFVTLIGAIVGEWFGDTLGLGVTLLNAMSNENVPVLWATILCSAVVGSGLYGLVAAIERTVVFWKEEM